MRKLSSQLRVFKAPNPWSGPGPYVFLAGSIEMGNAELWQDYVIKKMQQSGVMATVLNPRRDVWDKKEVARMSNPKFLEQVTWELDAQEASDHILMHYDENTKSPITLLELGLFASTGKLVVSCPEGFWRKGNVEVVCDRFSVPLFNTLDESINVVLQRCRRA
jgi:hypothetical protein